MRTDHFNIVISPEGQGRTWHLRVRTATLKVVAVCLGVAVLLLVVGVVSYWRVAALALQTRQVQQQNRELTVECQKIHELAAILKRTAEADQQLRQIAGGVIKLSSAAAPAPTADAELQRSIRYHPGTELLPSHPALEAPAAEPAIARSAGYSSSCSFSWPLYGGWISNEFTSGEKGTSRHSGIDLAVKEGTPVKAAGNGVVSFCGWTSDLGNLIVIDHGNGSLTRYGHNTRAVVEKGDIVKQGKIIAFAGSSGRSSAPHLHFEIWKDGAPVNPRDYLLR